ncbi:PREDICTED: gamma-glutamyl peptidase 3-like [Nelumbo nucifera]|uniref:Gamma-glutamyl peptidase 3-like n=1 Tax=Nelumbo nucifera TaxID=4432 RepID=A0A1U8AL34_NELNU|nr:PREDICTED: gamma-glutamyl peptidase 3-like [Nelumbo nucifera]
MKIEKGKRYAVLLALRDSDYVKKVYGGYFNVFVNAFGEEGDEWDSFRVVDGEFPDMEELHQYHGFVITGSPFDAHGNDPWVLRLCFLIQTLEAMQKKLLGICFGHQVLCRALGGMVGRAHTGWDIGVRKVKINVGDLPSSVLFADLKDIPPCLSVIECHQDEVWEVPAGAEVIASSEKTGVEAFSLGNHILGIQGHPEYTNDILYNLIDRLINNNSIEKEFAEQTKLRLETADEPDRRTWEKICRGFLKSK